jgi:hypothetical protein
VESSESWLGINEALRELYLNPSPLEGGVYKIHFLTSVVGKHNVFAKSPEITLILPIVDSSSMFGLADTGS